MKPFPLSQAALAVALALAAGAAGAVPGYVTNTSQSGVVVNGSGQCWRTGDWTPDKAAAPCDLAPRAAEAIPPVVRAEPAPVVAAAPLAPRTVIEKVTLSSDVLFQFDKAELRPEGQAKLDELARTAQGAKVEEVVIEGHADRIASDQYNQDLSERRAESVKRYLAARGVDETRIRTEGRGESQPVTGNECARMGPERGSNRKLVECLQPDRRVEVELLGQREVASGGEAPSSGASTSGAPASSPTPSSASPSSGSTTTR